MSFWLLIGALVITALIYLPGLFGTWLFDDYPNIVDNTGVHITSADLPNLVNAAMSSPASEFKRPLSSLSFAANYLATGLDPFWMKFTNLGIHLINGILVFILARKLLIAQELIRSPFEWKIFFLHSREKPFFGLTGRFREHIEDHASRIPEQHSERIPGDSVRTIGITATLVSICWMLLPINLTAVLYVVQREESMANIFVLLGLIGYIAGRCRTIRSYSLIISDKTFPITGKSQNLSHVDGRLLCAMSISLPTLVGILAKETAVMLPLYALLTEWALFRFKSFQHYANVDQDVEIGQKSTVTFKKTSERSNLLKQNYFKGKVDLYLILLFIATLAIPLIAGVIWLLPNVLLAGAWSGRNFTLATRLLSEARVVVDYIYWTFLPTPTSLSFYHDNFFISTGLLKPWTTLASVIALIVLVTMAILIRSSYPLVALGIALFLGCQLLTGTILPLELIYEHRNYFASFGLLLALVPVLAAPSRVATSAVSLAEVDGVDPLANTMATSATESRFRPTPALPYAMLRYTLLAGLLVSWASLTCLTAYAWGSPLRLAEDLAARAPESPRAQYELGRTYIIYSRYDPTSPYTQMAYAPLEHSASLPGSSILPEQALIFMNSRMHLPLKDAWWNSMIAKLKARKPGVQDESSLGALTECVREHHCDLPRQPMLLAYLAALSHPDPSARLLAMYGDYAWNVMKDHLLGERMTAQAVSVSPNEPAYRITMIRMLLAQGRNADAGEALRSSGN